MKKISIKYTLLLSLILSVLLVFLIYFSGNLIKDEAEYNSSSIINKITEIQELSLIEYHYTSVIGLKSNKSINEVPLPFTKKFFLATYDGLIKAGVDLSNANVEILDKDIKIILPKAEITNHIVDEKSLEVYDESKNILNPIKIEDFNNAIKEEKMSMEKKAIENGLIKQAEERATLLVTSFLGDLGFEKISVEIK